MMEAIKLLLVVIIAVLLGISISIIIAVSAITGNQQYALCIDHPTIAVCKDWKP